MITLAQHIGPRPTQEDYAHAVHLPSAGGGDGVIVAAVADGVGSRANGAAAVAVHSVIGSLTRSQRALTGLPRRMAPALYSAIYAADSAIIPTDGDTTMVLAVVGDGWFMLAHVGDSRAWQQRGGRWFPLTQPHGFGRYVLSTVGDPRQIDLLYTIVQEPGLLVLASDGLAEPIGDTASGMVAAQIAAGPFDNTTAIVIPIAPHRMDREIGPLVTL